MLDKKEIMSILNLKFIEKNSLKKRLFFTHESIIINDQEKVDIDSTYIFQEQLMVTQQQVFLDGSGKQLIYIQYNQIKPKEYMVSNVFIV